MGKWEQDGVFCTPAAFVVPILLLLEQVISASVENTEPVAGTVTRTPPTLLFIYFVFPTASSVGCRAFPCLVTPEMLSAWQPTCKRSAQTSILPQAWLCPFAASLRRVRNPNSCPVLGVSHRRHPKVLFPTSFPSLQVWWYAQAVCGRLGLCAPWVCMEDAQPWGWRCCGCWIPGRCSSCHRRCCGCLALATALE